jgi:hypothetical protein
MMLKAIQRKFVTIILALSLVILLASVSTTVPAVYAGDCSTQASGSCVG